MTGSEDRILPSIRDVFPGTLLVRYERNIANMIGVAVEHFPSRSPQPAVAPIGDRVNGASMVILRY